MCINERELILKYKNKCKIEKIVNFVLFYLPSAMDQRAASGTRQRSSSAKKTEEKKQNIQVKSNASLWEQFNCFLLFCFSSTTFSRTKSH